MKIILSRKGLDGGFEGARPSPILPCGRLLSLPIPVTANGEHGIPYADLRFDGQPVSEIISQLSGNRFAHEQAHLDPDLDRDRNVREQGWRPVFGQIGGPQTHLQNQGVGLGDLFLFFGWFRRTRYDNGQLRYLQPRKGGKNLHVIFGWLQVGEKPLALNGNEIPDWLHYHPHIVNRGLCTYINNTIYTAADHLTLNGHNRSIRSGGTFPCFKSSLQLTNPSGPMSRWRLPEWFYPTPPKPALSCHDTLKRWEVVDDYTFLRSVPRGQEFVFDTENYPEAIDWLKGLFEDCC